MGLLAHHRGDKAPGNLLSCRLDVAGVSGVVAAALRDQHDALAMKTHGVKFSRCAGDNHGLQIVLLQPCGDFFKMIHMEYPFSSFS